MANKLDVESRLLFEQPFAKVLVISFKHTSILKLFSFAQVPYENYRKVFRTSAKHIEREFNALQNNSKDITNRYKAGNVPSEDIVLPIDNMVGRMETLKRKVSIGVHLCFALLIKLMLTSFQASTRHAESQLKTLCANGCST
jgi:macrophage erythroblast attacher